MQMPRYQKHSHGIVAGVNGHCSQAPHRKEGGGQARQRGKESKKKGFKNKHIAHILLLHANGSNGPNFARTLADCHAKRIDDTDEDNEEQHKNSNESDDVKGRLELEHRGGRFVHGLHAEHDSPVFCPGRFTDDFGDFRGGLDARQENVFRRQSSIDGRGRIG